VGVVGDTRAAIIGVGPAGQSGDDQGGFYFPGNPATASGTLYRVDFADGGVKPLSTSFDTVFASNLLVSDAANVYWIGSSKVWSAPRDVSAATQVGAITSGTAVGLAVAGGVVSWAAVLGSSSCGNACTFIAQGCQVFSASTMIYDTTTTSKALCLGLATDATNAYFAVVEIRELPTCTSNCGDSPQAVTTGIARVSLAGPATQQPVVFPIQTDRMYGPRRFFVDDTYVYGIDPAYVVRVPKSAFGQ